MHLHTYKITGINCPTLWLTLNLPGHTRSAPIATQYSVWLEQKAALICKNVAIIGHDFIVARISRSRGLAVGTFANVHWQTMSDL